MIFRFCLLSLFLFTSCLKENLSKREKKKISISLNFNAFKKAAIKVSPADAAKALITIKKGGVEFIYRKLFDVYHKADGVVISIELEDGDYTLEELVLGTMTLSPASGTYPKFKDAKYIAPKTKDDHKTAVPKGKLLPYSFKVSGAKASASGSSLGSTGVGSGDVSLELVPIVLVPAIPGTINPGFNPADVFTFGFKVVSGGVKVDDCIIKIIKQGEALPIHYGPATKKDGDGNPYFTFRKGNSKYSFEISKFGYATRYSLKMLDAADASMYNKSQTIELKKIGDPTIGNTKNVYVKSVSSNAGETPSEKLQRGGVDFGSLNYWNYLAKPKAGLSGYFNIDQGEVAGSLTKIESKYKVVAGSYYLSLDVFGSSLSAGTVFRVTVGSETKSYKVYTPTPGLTLDGSVGKEYVLPSVSGSRVIYLKVITDGKISIELSSSDKSKVNFRIISLEKENIDPDLKIFSWTAGWKNENIDDHKAVIISNRVLLDISSANFVNKVVLSAGATISPDPNKVDDWSHEREFTVKKGAKEKKYKVTVKVNGRQIIYAVDDFSDQSFVKNRNCKLFQTALIDEVKTYGINANLNHINVSRVTNMRSAFVGHASSIFKGFNGDISKWDVSNVTNMRGMFDEAKKFNGDISKWDVSSVKTMEDMFRRTENFEQDISKWNVSNVNNMESMFEESHFNKKYITSWKVSSVKNMSYMFHGCDYFNQDISGWDVSGVTNMEGMFLKTRKFDQNISGWDVSKVTNMKYMFSYSGGFSKNIVSWDVSSVKDMSSMFEAATHFSHDLSSWDKSISQVQNCSDFGRNSGMDGYFMTDAMGQYNFKYPKFRNYGNCNPENN